MRTRIIAFVFCVATEQGQSMTSPNKLIDRLRHEANRKKVEVSTCTAFQGTWEGQCKDSDDEEWPKSLRIDQKSCGYLTFFSGESLLQFGSSRSYTFSSKEFNWSMTSFISWNLDQTKLNLVNQIQGTDHVSSLTGIAEEWDIYEIIGGKLKSNSVTINKDLRNIRQGPPYEVSCTYIKVGE